MLILELSGTVVILWTPTALAYSTLHPHRQESAHHLPNTTHCHLIFTLYPHQKENAHHITNTTPCHHICRQQSLLLLQKYCTVDRASPLLHKVSLTERTEVVERLGKIQFKYWKGHQISSLRFLWLFLSCNKASRTLPSKEHDHYLPDSITIFVSSCSKVQCFV
jgi:hypothetical protein